MVPFELVLMTKLFSQIWLHMLIFGVNLSAFVFVGNSNSDVDHGAVSSVFCFGALPAHYF
jgi:hypothetical protein